VHTEFRWGNVVTGYLEDLDIDRRRISKWVIKKQDGRAWTGLNWLKKGTSGSLL
jgi:hypothetical protein